MSKKGIKSRRIFLLGAAGASLFLVYSVLTRFTSSIHLSTSSHGLSSEDGQLQLKVRAIDPFNTANVVYEQTTRGTIKDGTLTASWSAPRQAKGRDVLIEVCAVDNTQAAVSNDNPVCINAMDGFTYNKVSCPYFVPAHSTGIIAQLSGWNAVSNSQRLGCLDDQGFLNSSVMDAVASATKKSGISVDGSGILVAENGKVTTKNIETIIREYSAQLTPTNTIVQPITYLTTNIPTPGAQGPQGLQGLAGATGAPGSVGPQGAPGVVSVSGGALVLVASDLSLTPCPLGQILKSNGTVWGCANDTDTQLSEAQVDAYVSNNGYITTEIDGSVTNEIQSLILSANILSISSGNSVNLSPYLDNTDNQALAWSGGTRTLSIANGGSVVIPDADTLGGLSCMTNQIAAWSGSSWGCANDTDTTYTAGTGISFAGTTISATLGTDITSSEIVDGTITGTDIATGTVSTTNITDGTITATDLAATGATAGTYGDSGVNVPQLTVNAAGQVTAVSNRALPTATGATTGVLSSADWTTFNGKENVLTFTGNGLFSRTGNTITGLACTAGQIPKWTGSAFACGTDVDTNTTYSAGNGLSLAGTTFSVNAPTCAGTTKLQWNGTAFLCAADVDTDTTNFTVSANGGATQTINAGNNVNFVNGTGTTATRTGSDISYGLTNVGTAGTYGSATTVPVITTDAQGRVTGVTNTAITFPAEVDGVIGNEVTNATANGGLVRSGSGTTGSPYTLGLLTSCTNGQVLKWTTGTTSWGCANDTDTTYTAGTGISFAGTTISATLGTDITSSEIVDGTITGTDIATGTVSTTNITDGTITATDLAATGATAGTYGDSGVNVPQLTVNAAGQVTAVSNRALPTATGATTGVLSSADWTTFNGKENVLTFTGNGLFSRTGNTITGLACTAGQIPKWTGSAFACGTDVDTNTTYSAGNGLSLAGTTFSVNAPTCAGTTKLQWNGTAFLCAADVDTDTTNFTVSANGGATQTINAGNNVNFVNGTGTTATRTGSDISYGLTNVGTAGTYGSATTVPVITTDAQGRVTGVTNTAITFPAEVDGVIGNEVTNATANGGLVRSGSGTTGSPYTLGLLTSCTNGQVLKWTTGTTSWGCANDTDTTYTAGTGISFAGTTISATLGTDITSSEIVDGTITGTDIATGTVSTTNITDGTITATDLAATGATAGTYGDSGVNVPQLTVNAAGQVTAVSNRALPTATGATTGVLSSADWTTFNGKENVLTFTGNGLFSRTGNTITGLACTAGQIPKWTGSAFACGTDVDTNTTYSAGNGLSLAGTTFSVNAPTCAGTTKLQWNGTAFLCAADVDTDTTNFTVSANGGATQTINAGNNVNFVNGTGTTATRTGSDISYGLTNVGTAGTYGSATTVPVITTDAQGRVTGVTNTAITFPAEVDGVIGNEVTNATANGGLVRSGSGTTGSPYTLGLLTSCTNGQVLKWTTGTTSWGCANDTDTTYTAGTGISFAGTTISATLGTDITSSEIVDGTITGTDIATGTVSTTNITDGTITATDLAATGATAGTYGDSGVNVPQLTVNAAGQVTAVSNRALPTATGATTGVLSSADWTTFNGKENVLTFTGNGLFSRTGNTITGLACTAGQIPKWTGSAFACGTDVDTNTTYSAGNGLSLAGTTFSVNAPTCAGTTKLQWNGTAFLCAADVDTDTTNFTVSANGGATQTINAGNNVNFVNGTGTTATRTGSDISYGLTNVGTAGTYGSATTVPVITTDAQGRVTGVTNTAITFPAEVDGVIGNEVTNATANGGLVRSGSGTTGSPYTLGLLTSCTNGQVLKWTTGTTSWGCANDTDTTYTAGTGISFAGTTISATLGTDITSSEIVDGTITTVDLANDAVTSAKVLDGTVISADIADGTLLFADVAVNGCTANQIFKFNGVSWACGADTAGISSLNGLTTGTQTFAVGTSGTDFGIVSSGSAHTFNIPDASLTARGLVTTTAQTLNGVKTFDSGVVVSSTACASAASSNNVFCQGGNSYGVAATLGTDDAFALNFETGGVMRVVIDASGNVGINTGAATLNSGLVVNTSLATVATTVVASGTLTALQQAIFVNANTTTQTLPTAASAPGRIYTIKNTNTASGTTVSVSGGGTIDGSISYALAGVNDSVVVQSDGSVWRVIAANTTSSYPQILVEANRTTALTPTVVSTALPYNAAAINIGTAYNTTTGIFTAPAAGIYEFNSTVSMNLPASASTTARRGDYFIELFNVSTGTIVQQVWEGNSNDTGGAEYNTTSLASRKISLTAGQQVSVRIAVMSVTGGPRTLYTTTAAANTLQVVRLR
jgi:lipopolysaccharide export system protein LptA